MLSALSFATPVLDQSNVAQGGGVAFLVDGNQQWVAQSFTSGQTGLLTAIQVATTSHPSNAGIMSISLRQTLLGPDLALFTYDNTQQFNGFLSFNSTSFDIYTTSGQTMFIVAKGQPNSFGSLQASNNAYAGGNIFFSNPAGNAFVGFNDHDLRFRTFVDTSLQPQQPAGQIPLPGSFFLVALGLVGICWNRKIAPMRLLAVR
jgi:hypothetical protein